MQNLAQETRQKFPRSNVTPVWLLFYWRLLKGPAKGDYGQAFQILKQSSAFFVFELSPQECAIVLVDHGLI